MKLHDYGLRKLRWTHFFKQFSIKTYREAAGLLTIDIAIPLRFLENKLYEYNTIEVFSLSIHLLPRKNHREWGFCEDWYDGPIYSFGLHGLLLLCWGRFGAKEKD